jgi:hypothetical protein
MSSLVNQFGGAVLVQGKALVKKKIVLAETEIEAGGDGVFPFHHVRSSEKLCSGLTRPFAQHQFWWSIAVSANRTACAGSCWPSRVSPQVS